MSDISMHDAMRGWRDIGAGFVPTSLSDATVLVDVDTAIAERIAAGWTVFVSRVSPTDVAVLRAPDTVTSIAIGDVGGPWISSLP